MKLKMNRIMAMVMMLVMLTSMIPDVTTLTLAEENSLPQSSEGATVAPVEITTAPAELTDGGSNQSPEETAETVAETETQAPSKTTEDEPTDAPAEVPAEIPTEKVTEIPDEDTKEESTDEPTDEPSVDPSDEPTDEPTEDPSDEPTDEPTGDPSDEPTDEPTGDPSDEPTDEPTGDPSDEPTDEPSEEPSEEPTEEPEPTHIPIAFDALKIARDKVNVNEEIVWQIVCSGAEYITYTIQNMMGETVLTGEPNENLEIIWRTDIPGRYQLIVVASSLDGEDVVQQSSIVAVGQGALTVDVSSEMRYAVAEGSLTYRNTVGGGVPPYTVDYSVSVNGNEVYAQSGYVQELTFSPTVFGLHTLQVRVTDAYGTTAQGEWSVPVAVLETETATEWESSMSGVSLTGDYAKDIVKIAKSQLGYHENDHNFLIDDQGIQRNYSRYGDYCGNPYGDWNIMFAVFCTDYAKIPAKYLPRASSYSQWKKAASDLFITDSDYMPQAGDLAFLSQDGGRIGVVSRVSSGSLYMIQGDSDGAVRQSEYKLSSVEGYISMTKVMERAGKLPPASDDDEDHCKCYDEQNQRICQEDCTCECHEAQETEEKEIILVDEATGIQVSFLSTEAWDNGLSVKRISWEMQEYVNHCQAILNALGNEGKSFVNMTSYDITLGETSLPSGTKVCVSMPIPSGYGSDLRAWYITPEGKAEAMEGQIIDGFFVFETDHFSIYALSDVTDAMFSFANSEEVEVETRGIMATVEWSEQNSHVPDAVEMKLYADGAIYEGENSTITVRPNIDGNWIGSWIVPMYREDGTPIVYTVEQVESTPYFKMTPAASIEIGADGVASFVNVPKYYEVDYTATVKWSNDDLGISGLRPDTITVTLYANDEPYQGSEKNSCILPDESMAATNDAGLSNEWKYVWTVPANDDEGNLIDYRVEFTPSEDVDSRYTLRTNTESMETTYTYSLNYNTVRANFQWIDNDNVLNVRPDSGSVFLDVLMDGSAYPDVDVKKPVTWEGNDSKAIAVSWSMPYRDKNNKILNYEAFQKTELLNYETTCTLNNNIFIITNTLKGREIKAKVIWDDHENMSGNRPTEVVLALYANGKPAPYIDSYINVSVGPDSEWEYTWLVPLYDKEGALIEGVEYSVEQKTQMKTHEIKTEYNSETDAFEITNRLIGENWNYAVDIVWDTPIAGEKYDRIDALITEDIITLKCAVTINTNAAVYDVGQLEVRVPAALWAYRDSNEASKMSDISIAEAPAFNPNFSFNYRYDDNGTPDYEADDELVFSNWQKIDFSLNQTLTIEYEVDPSRTIDFSKGILQAKGSGLSTAQAELGEEAEELSSREISYTLDTGIALSDLYKRRIDSVKIWDDSYGDKPDDYDPNTYNYVFYSLRFGVIGNQPWYATMTEYPNLDGKGGKIVSVKSSYLGAFDYDEATHTWSNSEPIFKKDSKYSYFYTYIVVAYPRVSHQVEDGEWIFDDHYENTYKVEVREADEHENPGDVEDQNGYAVGEVKAETDWVDYVYQYTGDLYYGYKVLESVGEKSTTVLNFGEDMYFTARAYFRVNGYNFGEYSFDMFDSDLYWKADGTSSSALANYVRMTPDDFELGYGAGGNNTALRISITSSDIDRTDGSEITTELIEEPFILYAQKGHNGAWDQIGKITEKSTTYNSAYFKGKGYTGFKLSTPKGLTNKYEVNINAYYRIKSTSPAYKEWSENYTINDLSINILNIAGFKLYQNDGTGNYKWVNPQTATSNYCQAADGVGLMAEDVAKEGSYIFRKSSMLTLKGSWFNSHSEKAITNTVVDQATSQVHVTFVTGAAETSRLTLPTSISRGMSIDSGVFYDLLPQGYTYDVNTAPLACAPGGAAYVKNVEVINDFKGTDRQMVIFHVETRIAAGYNSAFNGFNVFGAFRLQNGSATTYTTGLGIQYNAIITFEELEMYPSGINLVAFQRGDNRAMMSGGAYDTGTSTNFKNVTDASGKPVFEDINEDGVTDRRDTLYSYARVEPKVLQTIQTGIRKTVKGISGLYQVEDMVVPGGNYSYRLTFTSSPNGTVSNLKIIDILEEAENAAGAPSGSSWKGTFVGVNIKMPLAQGIDVKVYYSTSTELRYNAFDVSLDLSDLGIWSPDPPSDLSKVTAVAFDLGKARDGSNFEITEKFTTVVEIMMQAPSSTDKMYAYNRPSYSVEFRPEGSSDTQYSHNTGRDVKVQLKDLQTFKFYKMGETEPQDNATESDPIPLAGVLFKLYACDHVCGDLCADGCTHEHDTPGSGCWGTAIMSTLSSSDGEVKFADLDTGVYAIVEDAAINGYEKASGYWIIDVNAVVGTSGIKGPEKGTDDTSDMLIGEDGYTVINLRKKTSMIGQKVWIVPENEEIPESVKVILMRQLNNSDDPPKEYRWQIVNEKNDWKFSFEDLFTHDDRGYGYKYTISEVVPDGYEMSTSGYSPNIKLYNSKYISLTISKTVVDSDANRPFTFWLTLKKNNSKVHQDLEVVKISIDEAGNKTTESIVLSSNIDQDYEFTLKNGESIRIDQLTSNHSYQIREEEYKGYTSSVTAGTASSVTAGTAPSVTAGTASGSMSSLKGDSIVKFTNTYAADADLELKATKKVNGSQASDEENGKFYFKLTPVDDAPGDEVIVSSTDGAITFDSIHFTVKNAGETYEYKIREVMDESGTEITAGQKYGGYTYDDAVYTVTVAIKDNEDGSLKVTTNYYLDSESISDIRFNNLYEATGTLDIQAQKFISGEKASADADGKFTFELISSDDLSLKEGTTAKNINGIAKFETLQYDLADVGSYTYQIRELDQDGKHIAQGYKDGGYTYDDAVHTVVVTIEDNGDGTLAVTSEHIPEDESIIDIRFNNLYEATGTLDIQAQKFINDEKASADADGKFTFELTSSDDPRLAEGTTAEIINGIAEFGTLQYDLSDVGTYTYQVRELDQDGNHIAQGYKDGGYTYDDAVHTVVVTIEDNGDGTLAVTSEHLPEDESIIDIHFNNLYEATGTLDIQAQKFINDEKASADADGLFTFELTSIDKQVPIVKQTAKNVDGIITFDTITYTLQDVGKTHIYELAEVGEDGDGYTLDRTIHTVEVTLVDNGDGTLEVNPVFKKADQDVEEIIINNKYIALSDLTILKTVNGNNASYSRAFEFELELQDENGQALNGIYSYTGHNGAASGQFDISQTLTFSLAHDQSITIERLPDGAVYKVTETDHRGYVSKSSNAIGTIKANQEMIVTFVNTRNRNTEIPKTGDDKFFQEQVGAGVDALAETEMPQELEGQSQDATGMEEEQQLPIQEPAPAVHPDFEERYNLNPQIIGWLKAGERIDYPIVQGDNEYYLDHDYYGKHDSNGTLFLNMNNQLWPRDDVLLIHGHNMQSKAMFGTLMKYEKYDYLCQFPIVEFRTIYDDADVYYVPISGFNASMLPGNKAYFDITQMIFDDDVLDEQDESFGTVQEQTVRKSQEYQTYLDALEEWSLWESPVDVNVDDELLILVTCSYYQEDGRFMLVCRKLREGEDPETMKTLFAAD